LKGIILKKFHSSYFLIFKSIKFLSQMFFSAEQRQPILHCTWYHLKVWHSYQYHLIIQSLSYTHQSCFQHKNSHLMKIIVIFSFCYTTVVKVTEMSLNIVELDMRESESLNRLQRTDKRYLILRNIKKIAFLQTQFVCLFASYYSRNKHQLLCDMC